MVDTTDEWIVTRTGIRERRIAADHETASSMGIQAGRAALKRAGLSPEDLDLIIVATSTGDRVFPATASYVQQGLGASHAGAFDVNAACNGFLCGLATAFQFAGGSACRNVLVIGSEVYSRIIDWKDRSTCILFGDGAGAVVVQANGSKDHTAFVLGSDGSKADILYAPGIGDVLSRAATDADHYLRMKGPEVFKHAVNAVVQATQQVMARASLTLEDIDLFIPHQANLRIVQSAAKHLHLPDEKVFVNLERYGNTSSASLPIALCEAADEGRIKDGDHVVLVGVGGGFSWGAMLVQWDMS